MNTHPRYESELLLINHQSNKIIPIVQENRKGLEVHGRFHDSRPLDS